MVEHRERAVAPTRTRENKVELGSGVEMSREVRAMAWHGMVGDGEDERKEALSLLIQRR